MRTGAWLEAGTREAKPKVNGERLKGRTADVNRLLELQKRTKASKFSETYVRVARLHVSARPPGDFTLRRPQIYHIAHRNTRETLRTNTS